MGGMSFLPPGYPFNQTPLGQGTPQVAQPNPGVMTPEQLLAWYEALANTPQGKAAAEAQQQTIAMNVKQALAAMQNERDRIALAQGQAAADKWYKQESLKLAQQAHDLAVKTQQQNYELATGQMMGTFQGQPTLAGLGQAAQYTGLYNGTPTLQAINQENQFGLQQAGVTGQYQGAPTLQAINQQQQYGLQLGAQTGYQNGQATLPREQAAANTALQAAQIGASLRGPGDWAQYLQAMNGIAGSPASALVASAPGGLGQAAGPAPAPMTLASMLGQAGVMPRQSGVPTSAQYGQTVLHGDPSQGAEGPMMAGGGQMFAGGTPGFNEQTGSYSSAPAGGMRSTMPVGAAGGGGQRGARGFSDGGGTVATMADSGGSPYTQPGWNPQSMTGAIGQVASAPRVTNQQLGLTDEEAGTLKNYFTNPNQAPVGWWESKDEDQKAYLGGLNEYWGGSNSTFKNRYANSRTRQGAWNAAT